MKRSMVLSTGLLVLSFTSLAQADFVGNKTSKFFFPDTCSYVKLIKKENLVDFKTSAQALEAGYKASSKCSASVLFVGNKSSKLFFPVDCSFGKLIKDGNKVEFNSSEEAIADGYKASTKCSDKK